eukprot:scaffold88700_cov42-Prasinocladus_malaysianus.AAC.1
MPDSANGTQTPTPADNQTTTQPLDSIATSTPRPTTPQLEDGLSQPTSTPLQEAPAAMPPTVTPAASGNDSELSENSTSSPEAAPIAPAFQT